MWRFYADFMVGMGIIVVAFVGKIDYFCIQQMNNLKDKK